jgi:hypothetical protein
MDLTQIILEAYTSLKEEVSAGGLTKKGISRYQKFFQDENTKEWYPLLGTDFKYDLMPSGVEPNAAKPSINEKGTVLFKSAGGDLDNVGKEKYLNYLAYFQQKQREGADNEEKREDGSEAFPEIDLTNEPLDSEATAEYQESLRATEAEIRTQKLEDRLGRSLVPAEKRMVTNLYGTKYKNDRLYRGIWNRWQERTEGEPPTTQDALDFADEVVTAYEDLFKINKEILHGTKKVKDLSFSERELLEAFTFRKGELYYRGRTPTSFAGEVAGELIADDSTSRQARFGLRISTESNTALEGLDHLRNLKDEEGNYLLPKSSDESMAKAKDSAFRAQSGLVFEHTLEFLNTLQTKGISAAPKALEKLIKAVPKLQDMAVAAEENRAVPLEFADAYTVGILEVVKDAALKFHTEDPTAAQTIATFVGQFISRSKTLMDIMPKGLDAKQSGTQGAGFQDDGEIRNSDMTIKESKHSSEFAETLDSRGVKGVRSDQPIEVSFKYFHSPGGSVDLGMRDALPMVARPEKIVKAQGTQASRLGTLAGDPELASKTEEVLEKESVATKDFLRSIKNTNMNTIKASLRDKARSANYDKSKVIDNMTKAMKTYKNSKNPKKIAEAESKLIALYSNLYRNSLPATERNMLYANHFMTNGMSTSENQIIVASFPDEQNYVMHEDTLMESVALRILQGDLRIETKQDGATFYDGKKAVAGVGTRFKDGRAKSGATINKQYFQAHTSKI